MHDPEPPSNSSRPQTVRQSLQCRVARVIPRPKTDLLLACNFWVIGWGSWGLYFSAHAESQLRSDERGRIQHALHHTNGKQQADV